MRYKELVHREKKSGFDIAFFACEEDLNPRDCFEDEDLPEILDKLERGLLVWFCAKVTASKNGIELGTDYLGGCCYESAEDFCTTYKNDYYADMVKSAIREAKESIAKLNGRKFVLK